MILKKMDEKKNGHLVEWMEKWMNFQFTAQQTTILPKWMFFQKLFFNSSLLLATTQLKLPSPKPPKVEETQDFVNEMAGAVALLSVTRGCEPMTAAPSLLPKTTTTTSGSQFCQNPQQNTYY